MRSESLAGCGRADLVDLGEIFVKELIGQVTRPERWRVLGSGDY
jgi:hypothetical protein